MGLLLLVCDEIPDHKLHSNCCEEKEIEIRRLIFFSYAFVESVRMVMIVLDTHFTSMSMILMISFVL
jgi:hypothetical protein